MKNLIILITILFVFNSCEKKKVGAIDLYDCKDMTSVLDPNIDDNEFNLIVECNENQLQSKLEIEEEIQGTWELIGYGGGWLQSNQIADCILLDIMENSVDVRLISSALDTTFTSSYHISDDLYVDVEMVNHSFRFTSISSNLMYFNHTDWDGDMYLFEKMK